VLEINFSVGILLSFSALMLLLGPQEGRPTHRSIAPITFQRNIS